MGKHAEIPARGPGHPARRISRKNWAIMAAGLWAGIFQRTNTHAALTRWVDLEEEIQEA